MAFINEYISEENIEKYQINELMNSYSKYKDFPKKHYKHRWTIDKEKESWFMWTHDPTNPLEDHRRGTGETIFRLYYKKKNIDIVLRKDFEESSEVLTDNPFYVTWKLDHIKKPIDLEGTADEEIIKVLKEALNIYGTRGIKTSVPFENIIVKLKIEES